MADYLPSAHYRDIIRKKYNREPMPYLAMDGKQYEDLEFIRSKMHEDGDTNYLGTTLTDSEKATNDQQYNYLVTLGKIKKGGIK
jgi:carboxypeptidase C (cathepsin A)